MHGQPIDRDEVNGEKRQRPEWVGRDHQQLYERTDAEHHDTGPPRKLILEKHADPTNSCSTPTQRTIHPQVLRSPKT